MKPRRKPVHALASPAVQGPYWLGRAIWQALVAGSLALLLLPTLRGSAAWFGPGAVWLLVAPASSLLVFYRHALAAAWRRGPRSRVAPSPANHDFRPTRASRPPW